MNTSALLGSVSLGRDCRSKRPFFGSAVSLAAFVLLQIAVFGNAYAQTEDLTGAWTETPIASGNWRTTTTNNVEITASTVVVPNAAWSSVTTGTMTLNNVGVPVYTNADVYGRQSLQARYWWDDVFGGPDPGNDGTGTITFTFSKPVKDPILFVDRLGGTSSLTSFSAQFTLNGGLTWTELLGNGQFDSTGTTMVRTTDLINSSGSECTTAVSNPQGTACGTLQISGEIESFSMTWEKFGLLADLRDLVEFVIEATPMDFGDAPPSYDGSDATVAARHTISSDLYLGAGIADGDNRDPPWGDATGDDNDLDTGDDEDGVTFRSPAGSGDSIFADVLLTNTTGGFVTVCGWLDIPVDGTFDAADAPDVPCQTTDLANTTLTFQWSGLPTDQAYSTYARFRVTSDALTSLDATGFKAQGEVEDYPVAFDFQPTQVTIGDVSLESFSVAQYLASADLNQLRALLASYGMDADGMDGAALIAALTEFLDPDGDDQIAVLRWDTLEERGTIGFYVERQAQGVDQEWIRVNNDLLPGMITAPMGAEYQLTDPAAQSGTTYQYRLIELEADGNTRTYGPFGVQTP